MNLSNQLKNIATKAAIKAGAQGIDTSKYHAKCVCSECNEDKTLFLVHPQDESQELYICSDCAYGIQYAMSEVQSGRATEREGAMYGI